jgi:hypothetical protein
MVAKEVQPALGPVRISRRALHPMGVTGELLFRRRFLWPERGSLLFMAFGITGKYVGTNGKPVDFAACYSERRAKISSFPDYSIQIILIYAHGAPGLIGDDDVGNLTKMLRTKMRINGQIHLLG